MKGGKISQAQILEHMKAALDKLGVTYKEHSFRAASLQVKSGFCIIEGELHFIMDRRKKPKEKLHILATALGHLNLESIHIAPDIRNLIEELR
ncbi:MAG: hypothetical protein MI742_16450 [Desulfobacterales bacterium]|nr:hypothetical protein [Desulfobacterales bacterium]